MVIRSQAPSLSWRSHLRICRGSVLSHRMYPVYALLFPVLVIVMGGSDGIVYRTSAMVLMALLPTGLLISTALTGEQLRAFGMVTVEQRRHRRMMIGVAAVFSVVAFGVYSAVNGVSLAHGAGLPWWCLGCAAVLAAVLLLARAIPSGASGESLEFRQAVDEEAPDSLSVTSVAGTAAGTAARSAVRRTWRPLLRSICALVVLQMVIRTVASGMADTAMTVLMLVVGMTTMAAGGELADQFRTMLVFGGSRSTWARGVLREGAVLPLAGAVGAVVAVALEKVVVEELGWADASPLVTARSLKDAAVIAIAGAATGVVIFLVGMVSTLADVQLPGWASVVLILLEAAAVVGLLVAVWAPGTDAWQGEWWTLSGGLLVCLVGGGVGVPLLAWLASRSSLRTDRKMSAWLGMKTLQHQ